MMDMVVVLCKLSIRIRKHKGRFNTPQLKEDGLAGNQDADAQRAAGAFAKGEAKVYHLRRSAGRREKLGGAVESGADGGALRGDQDTGDAPELSGAGCEPYQPAENAAARVRQVQRHGA